MNNVIDILDKDIISQNEKVEIKLRANIRIYVFELFRNLGNINLNNEKY
jgi:hypothetical protein